MTSDSILCPMCGEENAQRAAVCWACHTPFSDEGEAYNREMKSFETDVPRERTEKVKLIVYICLSVCCLWAITFSGYVPDYSFALISGGSAGVVGLFAWAQWDKHIATRHRTTDEADKPVERVVNLLLRYAVRDGASQIRLRAGLGIQVHYFIKDEWHEQMRLPSELWEPIRHLFFKTTGRWQKAIIHDWDGRPFDFWPEFKRDHEYPFEELVLTLGKAKLPAPLPEP